MSHKIKPIFTDLGTGTPDSTTYLRGDGSWATPAGSPSSIPVGNTIFVSKDGNDGTGTRERLDLPFLTIVAAEAAAVAGDTIVVFSGDYEESGPINTDVVTAFKFIGEGTVSQTTPTNTPLFDDLDSTNICIIDAPGWIFNGRGNQSIIKHRGINTITIIAKELVCESVPVVDSFNSGTINIQADRIACTVGSFSVINLATATSCSINAGIIEANVGEVISIATTPYVNIRAKSIVGNSASGDYTVSVSASNLTDQIFISAEEIYANTGWVITTIGSSDQIFINARTIRGSGTCTVVSENTMLYVRADEIINNRDASTYGNIHSEGGNMTCIGARLVREGSGGGAAIKTSLSGTVKLIAVHYDKNSINEGNPGEITRIDDQFKSGIWVDGITAFIGDLSPAQLTADVDDYNPTGLTRANVLRLSSDASRNLNGLQGGEDGRILFIHNVGTNNIVIVDEALTSTAANRFNVSANVTLAGDQSVMIQYDSTSSRWRVVGGAGGGGSYTDEQAQDAVGNNFLDTDTINATYTDATPSFSWDVRTQMSITSDASGIKLSGDEASPGNREFYATSDTGVKGWRPAVVADIADYVGSAWYIVAASDAPTLIKERADYVCDGTADESEINTALALGNVQLTQGTYNIAATIDMPSNRWLRGSGDGTLLLANTVGLNVISETAATGGVRISDLKIDGTTGTTARGIYMTSVGSGTGATAVPGCVIENVFITGTDFGVELELCANSIVNKVRTVDLDFDGVVIDRCNRVTVSNTEHFGNFAGIFVTGTATKSTHINVYGNICEGMGDMGIQVENCTDSIFSNNIIRTTVNQGLDFQNNDRILAIGNLIDGAQDQPGLNTSTCPNSAFIGNTVQNCNSDGMVISGCDSSNVVGNHVYNCGLGTNNTFDAVSIFSNDVNFIGNTIKRGTGNQHRYGLRINGANRCLISGNDLYLSGATGDINDTGTNTRKRDNKANDGTWLDLAITNYQFTMSTSRLLGRTTAATGAIEEITVGAPLTFSAGALDFDETATLDNNARVAVNKNSGAVVGTRRRLNFIEGSNVTLTIADDAGNEEVDITIAASGTGGGISRTVTVTSGSATMGNAASTDYMYFVAGAHTMSLPAASGNTNRYTVKNNHSANITIDTAGAENIEGAASISLAPEESVDIMSDGTNWFIV